MKYSLEEIQSVAKKLLDQYGTYKIWCFDAGMGMGKTTLIKEICKYLGVQDEMSSPSFAIVNPYQTDSGEEVYHFDFYRIKNIEEAEHIGIYDYFDSGSYCFLEWPENISAIIPDDSIQISIKLVDENTRFLTVDFND